VRFGRKVFKIMRNRCVQKLHLGDIFTEAVSAEAEEINVLVSYLFLVKRPIALETT
jgi:hypothetical protein